MLSIEGAGDVAVAIIGGLDNCLGKRPGPSRDLTDSFHKLLFIICRFLLHTCFVFFSHEDVVMLKMGGPRIRGPLFQFEAVFGFHSF